MGLPMLASFLLAICLISTLFDPLPAKAETSLDIVFDFKDGLMNLAQSTGDFEQLKSQYFLVENFYGRDQCMATPEAQIIHSFGIYFQLPKNGFNGGKGMAICYAGELDKNNMANGLVPSKQYRVQNVGNEVAETCEAARLEYMAKCKGDKKCLDFVNAPWHGFRVSQKENSQDLEIHLSTSNHVFIIPASKIPDGEFFLKLTKWNTLVATVSTEIGPGHHEYGDRRRKEKVDTGLIPVEKDAKLRQGFFANVGKGALLAKYMGIWSLAADILPHAQDDVLQFFVILSDCSNLKASFMLPSDSEPPKPKNGFGPLPINAKFFLSEEPMTQIRGRMKPNAMEFVIQLIKMQIDENKLNGIRIKVGNFDANGKGIGKLQICKDPEHCFGEEKESEWKDVKIDDRLEFFWNADFILKIMKAADHMNVSLNCKEFKTFKIGSDKLAFNERYLYNISGDVDIFDTTKGKDEQKQIEKEDKFMRSTVLHVTTGHGILIRGEMKEWGQIDIIFYKEKEVNHYGQSLKISMRHFVFRATRNNNKAVVEMANENMEMEEKFNVGINEFDDFSLHVQLKPTEIVFTLNDEKIGNIALENETSIDTIKTSVDAKVEHYKNIITYLPPRLMAVSDGLATGNYFTFNGFVPHDAISFEILLLKIAGKTYKIGECANLGKKKCQIMLKINFDFYANQLIVSSDFNATEDPKSWPAPFTRGSYFYFQISLEKDNVFKLISNKNFENSYVISENVYHTHTTHIEINGDIWFSEEPKIGKFDPTKIAISFFASESGPYPPGTIIDFASKDCDFVFHLEVDFNNKSMVFLEHAKQEEQSRIVFNSSFDRGAIFSLQMRYIDELEYNVTQGSFSYSFSIIYNRIRYINYLEIIGDVWLFGEPKLIPNNLMGKTLNTIPKDER